MIGQSISHYEIIAKLGQGGMGEVYRARDTKLNRDVALKVLPEMFANDEQRMGRFSREAQVLASLNHPNIAAIHGLEESEGQRVLVMELVEGEDLAERLARGPIPVDDALPIALQIAEALEDAHEKGIVHRDLKPANIKLTPEGKVKVLDFGLAKALEDPVTASRSGDGLTHSPTLSMAATQAGVILGTAAYMAPEQARGMPVDRRADIWSFGVLLWEILTGRSLYKGETITDVIAAVVTQDPDLDSLPVETPLAVRRLLSRCLRKDPRKRLTDIGSARLVLEEVLTGTLPEEENIPIPLEAARIDRQRRTRERMVLGAALLVLVAFAGILLFRTPEVEQEPQIPFHFIIDQRDHQGFDPYDPISISPDGRYIVTVGRTIEGSQLYIRSSDSPEFRLLSGTVGATSPFWSPDSKAVGFFAAGELRKVVLAGGTVQRICAVPSGFDLGATWSAEGTIVFSIGGLRALLYSVPAAGGEAKLLTSHNEERGELGHWTPRFLPDSQVLLFLVSSAREEYAGLHALSLDSPEQRWRIRPGLDCVWYSPPGYLLFVRENVLFAESFDAEALAVTADPVPIVEGVGMWAEVFNFGWFSVSNVGQVTWVSERSGESSLQWIDRSGQTLETLGEPAAYGQLALSPDNTRVIVELGGTESGFDLWGFDVERGVAIRLTRDSGDERDPVWSPDSRGVVFSSDREGDQNLLYKSLEGSEPPQPLPNEIGQTPGDRDIAESWSMVDDTLIYLTLGEARNIWAVSVQRNEPPELVKKDQFALDETQLSPDGRWLAYTSTESGRSEIYLEPFRQSGERVRVSVDGGGQPKWRGDSKELFFLSLLGELVSVAVMEESSGLAVGLPTRLVPAETLNLVTLGPDYDDYAVTSDGQRFLVKREFGGEESKINVLLNWTSRLQ